MPQIAEVFRADRAISPLRDSASQSASQPRQAYAFCMYRVIGVHVRLIGESSRKDDQLDARTLARLARIDPGLLGPVRHRSAKRLTG